MAFTGQLGSALSKLGNMNTCQCAACAGSQTRRKQLGRALDENDLERAEEIIRALQLEEDSRG